MTAEYDSYLATILGNEALRIDIAPTDQGLIGNLNLEEKPHSLSGIEQHQGIVSLAVTKEHMSGHFSGPLTLPAYRILEMMTELGNGAKVTDISNALFKRIITPGDVISVTDQGTKTFVHREGQEVACADIVFGEQGLEAHEFGMLLEIASQTIVANMAKRKTGEQELFYPLVLNVARITLVNSQLGRYLTAHPTLLGDFQNNRFIASAQISNDQGIIVAKVENIGFEFATAKKIGIYESIGRNFHKTSR